jgi:hypothetical protein
MAGETVKLPRSSYGELTRIVVAYGKLTEPSGLDEISKRAAMNRTVISANNAFLSAVGLLEGGKRKVPTPKCRLLAHALEHDIAEEVSKAWTSVITENDFLSKMLQAVSIRRGMQVPQLEAHIAYSAGEQRTDDVMTGARAVIDILKASGLVIEEDGQILPAAKAIASAVIPPSSDAAPTRYRTEGRLGGTQARIAIRVNINATPAELDGLADKIKAFLATLEETLPDSRS